MRDEQLGGGSISEDVAPATSPPSGNPAGGPPVARPSGLTACEVREDVARVLEIPVDEVDDGRDLFELGLDSLRLMSLVSAWRRRGWTVSFQDLSEDPVLETWVALISKSTGTEPVSPVPAHRPAPVSASLDEEEAPYPLATMQHAYWVGRQDGQPLGGVAAHFYTELDGHDLDPRRLGEALEALTARHGMLRVRIDDEGRQHHVATGPRLTVHDLRDRSAEEVDAVLDDLRERYTHARMDVAAGEVIRIALSLLPQGRTRLHLDLDMIAGDALSLRNLLSDLRRLYEEPGEPLPPIGLNYRRYLAERARRRGPEREESARWWRERIPDLPGSPQLPTTVDLLRPVSAADTALTRTGRLHHWLDPEAKAALIERSRRHGITPAALLATAFAEVVAAWSGTQRFLLNLPLFDREMITPDVAQLVGDFSSSIMLDADLRADLPVVEQARQLQARLRAAVAHGAYGGVEVLRDLSRHQGGPVLAPVVYTSAIGLGEIYDSEVQACFGRPVWIISQGPQVALDAQVTELDGGLLLNWDVREGVFAPGALTAAFAAYRRLVTDLVRTDAAWLRPVGPLLPAEQLARRTRAALPPAPASHDALHTRFFDVAERHPERVAVIREDGTELSYGRLALDARRVAALLHRHGVHQGDAVAVTLPRGADQITAVLGVLAAGAAYVPVGTEQPPVRRADVHRTAGAAIVLTDDAHVDLTGRLPGVTVLRLAEARFEQPATVVRPAPECPAYLLFTSGSTGRPKGVEVPHRAVVNTIDAVGDLFGIGPDDGTLALAPLDFDMATYDLFAPLSAGGRVVALGEEHQRDARHWAHLVREHGVTVINCVPALLDMLMDAVRGDAPNGREARAGEGLGDSLRLVLLGGDWVGLDQPDRLRALVPGCRFVALGGMTEAAIHSTVFEVEQVDPAWRSVPWGVPLRNMRARVVDERGRDRPDHVPGELWVGGLGVASGYRGDPERTAARFVEYDGERWYRTGDLARYGPGGIIEFLGRADHQVKIRGHRIELGEVESALEAHPGVLHAVAAVIEAPARRLGAVVSPADGQRPDPDELLAWAADRLPSYMLPDPLLVQDAMPLTANGKLDRSAAQAALNRAVGERPIRKEAPNGPVEQTVARIWAELLDLPEVGRDDGFFALGGDSLIATRMVVRLRAAGLHGAGVAALFGAPALRDFAALLTVGREDAPGTGITPDPRRAHEPFPLTDVQTAYLIGRRSGFTLGNVGTWHYSEFDGPAVDLERLTAAWRRLIQRHGMLRAVIEDDAQRVLETVPEFRIGVRDVDAAEAEQALAALRDEMSHQVRDPARWPLFDVRAVRYQDGSGTTRVRLGIGLDHLVLDALSITTLYAELNRLYADPAAELPPVELAFRDYVTGLPQDPDAQERARAHWSRRLEELPPAPTLPLDRDPALVETPRFTRRRLRLDEARWQAVKEESARHGLTPSTVLLAAYGEVLSTWSGSDAVTVTLTLFNRRDVHPHVHRVLGDFTGLAPTAYRRSDRGWLAAAKELQRRQAEDLDHHDVPASWLLRELGRRTGTLDAAVPVVFTSALGVGDATLSDAAAGFPPKIWGVSQSPQVCLDHQVTEESGELVVTWDAVEELFCEGVLDAMVDAHTRLLDHLAGGDWTAPIPDLTPADQRQTRAALNRTRPTRPRLLHETFFTRAAAERHRTALVTADGRTVDYGALADAALRTATALGERGVREGDLVAVTLPKGPEQIIAVLGVLAAGAAYVPIGVEQPTARRDRIRTTARVRLTIGARAAEEPESATDDQRAGASIEQAPSGDPVLTIDEALTAAPADGPRAVPPTALAYVIFTSGSTGEPKGVAMSHAAAWNTVTAINTLHGIGPDDRVFALSALDFDLSVYDIFGLLAAGGSLLLPTEEQRREPHQWPVLVREHEVTAWNTVPALLDLLLDADDQAPKDGRTLLGLRTALISGDWIGLDLPGRLRERTADGCRFIAMGGATEAAVWSNTFTVDKLDPAWPSIPYGHPLPGQRYRVVGPGGRDCPDWVAGELWIGGAGLAAGYLGDQEHTAQKFVHQDGQRWYRTGDLGRYRPGGLLEFLGRMDGQLKIAGHRIESGEVEAAIEAHPYVTRAAVVAAGERTARRLAAFAVLAQDGVDDPRPVEDWLRPWLGRRLAPYAVPSRVTVLPALPLTGNGKVDRRALAALAEQDAPDPGTRPEPPQGQVEIALAELWGTVLPGSVRDRHTDFLTMGGDSLSAIRLASAIERRFGVRIPVRRLLAAPTVAALGTDVAAAVAANETEIGEL
ncbi:amino acid adenylation domain-containing protein [Actinoallomurus spadix]|uniref:non-ribosomal peptide synthetase n=1 Tax=Actinoallomurus spadix TaxID=79912 RepID=UPI002093A16E|nr:non-ribosomal peptide synthetase [Actinoallomurus spadix]MCO5987221.1 amino acid adenylation domain-containing protein [Actinoallomurus spadix]